MNLKELNSVLDYILGTTIFFLENDMKIKVGNISVGENLSHKEINNSHSALVWFNGKVNFFCLIEVDMKLLERIFKVLLPYELSSEEKNEMMESLPYELVNTVAGLAISKFSPSYGDLVMSEPFALSAEMLETFDKDNLSASKRIQTDFGNFSIWINSVDEKLSFRMS